MSFKKCVDDGVAEGIIPEQEAAEIRGLFDELEASYEKNSPRAAAAAQAAINTLAAVKRQKQEKARRTLLQADAQRNAVLDIEGYRTMTGKENVFAGAEALLVNDNFGTYSSAEQKAFAIKQIAQGKMTNVLASFRRNVAGSVRNKAKLKNMVREVFGEDTKDVSAREMAQAWKEAAEFLRLKFNEAGGAIPSRSDWGMPQIHDSVQVRKVPKDEWVNFVINRLDQTKMIDERTGLPWNEGSLRIELAETYTTISQEGLNKISPSGARMGKSLGDRRQDHRFLVFKDADNWMEYQDKFGNPNAFDNMLGHIDSMSKDIAIMQRMGPNPTATMNYVNQYLRKKAGPENKDKAGKAINRMQQFYKSINGTLNAPLDGFWANTLAGTRQLLTASQLGSAFFTAFSDMNTQLLARQFSGLSQVNTLKQVMSYMNPLGLEERGKLATRLGLIAEGWTSLASAQMRYMGDISGPEVTRRIADGVLRVSLLSPWTQAGRWAFGMEFLGTLADNVGKTFDELPKPLKLTFDRYGIDKSKWNVMRSTELLEDNGATFFSAENLVSRTDLTGNQGFEIGTRVLEMINTETNFAVPSSSTRGKLWLTGDSKPGSFSGEVLRSFAMYKNFGVTIINTHLIRAVEDMVRRKKGNHMAQLIIGSTVFGAFAMQMKEIAKGRDPREMDNPETMAKFWGSALLQGGGLGIYGDFLFTDVNRFGGGIETTIGGPVAGLVSDVAKLTVGNIFELADGKDTKAASEAVDFVRRYTPGNNIWYLRLALERQLFDQMAQMADPKVGKKWRRKERSASRDYGTQYWWRPGEMTPSRAPDPSNAIQNIQFE